MLQHWAVLFPCRLEVSNAIWIDFNSRFILRNLSSTLLGISKSQAQKPDTLLCGEVKWPELATEPMQHALSSQDWSDNEDNALKETKQPRTVITGIWLATAPAFKLLRSGFKLNIWWENAAASATSMAVNLPSFGKSMKPMWCTPSVVAPSSLLSCTALLTKLSAESLRLLHLSAVPPEHTISARRCINASQMPRPVSICARRCKTLAVNARRIHANSRPPRSLCHVTVAFNLREIDTKINYETSSTLKFSLQLQLALFFRRL